MEGQPLRAALAAAAAGRDRHADAGAPDPGAAAEERRAARRDPRGRDHRQPRGRGEDHRPAALAPGGHRRRHRARQRPGRADPEPGAARAPRDARAEARGDRGAARPRSRARRSTQRPGAPLVMVVDDSLTVRKITSRMLAREGYEVATREGRRGRAAAAAGHQARLHPARRRDAAHGRLRIRAQRARRRRTRAASRSS